MRTIDVFGVLRPLRLGGMLEDYQNEINKFKSDLEKANPPNPGAYGYNPPPTNYPPASGGGAQGPTGSPGTTGQPQGEVPEFSKEQNLNPGDTGTLAPPISVHGGDEIPPPVPTGAPSSAPRGYLRSPVACRRGLEGGCLVSRARGARG